MNGRVSPGKNGGFYAGLRTTEPRSKRNTGTKGGGGRPSSAQGFLDTPPSPPRARRPARMNAAPTSIDFRPAAVTYNNEESIDSSDLIHSDETELGEVILADADRKPVGRPRITPRIVQNGKKGADQEYAVKKKVYWELVEIEKKYKHMLVEREKAADPPSPRRNDNDEELAEGSRTKRILRPKKRITTQQKMAIQAALLSFVSANQLPIVRSLCQLLDQGYVDESDVHVANTYLKYARTYGRYLSLQALRLAMKAKQVSIGIDDTSRDGKTAALHVSYVDASGNPLQVLLNTFHMDSGCTVASLNVIIDVFGEYILSDTDREAAVEVSGLFTDGAATMAGVRAGLGVQLQSKVDYIFHHLCLLHGLALMLKNPFTALFGTATMHECSLPQFWYLTWYLMNFEGSWQLVRAAIITQLKIGTDPGVRNWLAEKFDGDWESAAKTLAKPQEPSFVRWGTVPGILFFLREWMPVLQATFLHLFQFKMTPTTLSMLKEWLEWSFSPVIQAQLHFALEYIDLIWMPAYQEAHAEVPFYNYQSQFAAYFMPGRTYRYLKWINDMKANLEKFESLKPLIDAYWTLEQAKSQKVFKLKEKHKIDEAKRERQWKKKKKKNQSFTPRECVIPQQFAPKFESKDEVNTWVKDRVMEFIDVAKNTWTKRYSGYLHGSYLMLGLGDPLFAVYIYEAMCRAKGEWVRENTEIGSFLLEELSTKAPIGYENAHFAVFCSREGMEAMAELVEPLFVPVADGKYGKMRRKDLLEALKSCNLETSGSVSDLRERLHWFQLKATYITAFSDKDADNLVSLISTSQRPTRCTPAASNIPCEF